MITAALDTNVLVSGITGFSIEQSVPGAILRAWARGSFEVVLSEPIIEEVTATLDKPYFRRRLSPKQIARLQRLLTKRARITCIAGPVERVATHPEDDLILASADAGHAKYLATGDRQLQLLRRYKNVMIVSPREFLEILTGEIEAGGSNVAPADDR